MSLPNKIRIAIADDHKIIRTGLKSLLRGVDDFVFLGEATNGKEAISLVETLQPDVLLIDVLMPQMTGIQAVEILRQRGNGTKIVILSSLEDYEHIDAALAAGANGYLSKEVQEQELQESIRAVMEGDVVFSSSIIALINSRNENNNQLTSEHILDNETDAMFHSGDATSNEFKKQTDKFYKDHTPQTESTIRISRREQEILSLVADGLTTKQIADKLYISPRTVDTHRMNLMQKLGLNNVAGLIRYALTNSPKIREKPK